MSLRRSTRQSSGEGGDAGRHGRKLDVDEMKFCSKPNDNVKSHAKPKRLFVGDSVEFCPSFSQMKMVSKTMNSELENDKEVTQSVETKITSTSMVPGIGNTNELVANLAPNSNATGIASTDSIVSHSTSSSDNSKGATQKHPLLSSSSFSSLASDANNLEPPTQKTQPLKQKIQPLFKKKLRINLNDDRENSSEPKLASNKKDSKRVKSIEEKRNCDSQKPYKTQNTEEMLYVHSLLSRRNERFLQAQSKLTLSQLKQQARQKARKGKVQPKRKKRGKNGRNKRQKPTIPSDEIGTDVPMDTVELNTGTLYLYRGENPRVKFQRRR